jgi:PRTRC genetic system protein E
MLFKSIHTELRSRLASVGVAITFAGENKMNVIITPTLKAEVAEKAPHLNAPFMLTGTPEELDAGFAEQFKAYSDVHASLQQQVVDQIASLKAETEAKAQKAKDDAAKKSANKATTSHGGKPASPAGNELAGLLSGDSDDGNADNDEDAKGSGTPSVLPASVTSASNAPVAADALF